MLLSPQCYACFMHATADVRGTKNAGYALICPCETTKTTGNLAYTLIYVLHYLLLFLKNAYQNHNFKTTNWSCSAAPKIRIQQQNYTQAGVIQSCIVNSVHELTNCMCIIDSIHSKNKN